MSPDHSTLDDTRILGRPWRFFHEHGGVSSEFFQFMPDGTISGYDHPNERYWALHNGTVSLLNSERQTTVIFEHVETLGGRLLLKGRHIPYPEIVLCLEEKAEERAVYSPTKDALTEKIAIFGWSVGDHTYGVPFFYEEAMAKFSVGKYCSIAHGVEVALGDHRVDTLTTYPFKSLAPFWQHVPRHVDDHTSKGDVCIGSDVWIGSGAFIGSGVTIGSGAIIAAKSVVVKDVPPYAIVAGNPAKIIRYRFEPPVIDQLVALAWWDLEDYVVDLLLPVLMSDNAITLIAVLREVRAELARNT